MTGDPHDVVILGAGFGGLAMAHHLAASGVEDVIILERGDGVGGTWRQNTYPGAACDVPSHLYSLSFAPNPDWSRTYATQPEILRYVQDCYDRFDLRSKVRSGTEVVTATWDDERRVWRVADRSGAIDEGRILVSAVGLFHTPAQPEIPGLDEFAGATFHSARWDHDHDLTGARVAVVGTGASAIQIVPAIAGVAAQVDVYQRTPAWILPRKDVAYSVEERRAFADRPDTALRHRQELHALFEQNTSFLAGDPSAVAIEEMARSYIDRKVADPELRARLTPTYPIGCKRTLVSSAFYPALQRPDVELVTTGIDRVVPSGIRTVDGAERPCDTIVMCTGFRATEYLRGIQVVGRDGADLHAWWAGVPRAYLGLAVPGFPNLFMMYGPNTNQGGNSILLILEAQARFVTAALETMREDGARSVEVRPDAMDRHRAELEGSLEATVWASGCDSYFRTTTGHIVTQLPHTSGWYEGRTGTFPADDFVLAR